MGVQTQHPQSGFYALSARVSNFVAAELDSLLVERQVIRMALLRSTVFLFDAYDAGWIRQLAQPTLDAEIRQVHQKKLLSVAVNDVLSAANEILTETELSGKELGKHLLDEFPSEQAGVLVAIARCGLPLVQIPPRGLWQQSGAVCYARYADWVVEQPAVGSTTELVQWRKDLICMYLRGFGPATAAGISQWSGLTQLAPLLAEMETEWILEKRTGPGGIELYDVDGGEIIDSETPASVKFIGPFENIVLAQADKQRVISPEIFSQLATPNGIFPALILIDGWVQGTWEISRGLVTPTYFRKLTKTQAAQAESEIARLEKLAII